jgi:hypothetical protein
MISLPELVIGFGIVKGKDRASASVEGSESGAHAFKEMPWIIISS